jgi:outer membrane protein OmpA-like peptidoglycan-associated protein
MQKRMAACKKHPGKRRNDMKKLWILVVAVALAACAHGKDGTMSASEDITVRDSCANSEDMAEAAAIRQRSQLEFMELKGNYQNAIAYRSRWKDSFSRIDRMVKVSFDPSPGQVAAGSMENVIRYEKTYVGGVMHLSFPNEQLFEKGKSQLHEAGRELVSSLVQIVSKVEKRRIEILSRSTTFNEGFIKGADSKVMELSMKRAINILDFMADSGLDKRELAAAANGLTPEEEAFEKGTTTLLIHPSAGELPKYPDEIK